MSDLITNAELRIEAKRLCDENDQLKAENAKLRKDFESVGTAAYLYGRNDLKADNAKLRELVVSYDSALHRLCDQTLGCVDCRVCILGKDYGDDSCAIDELRDAARELEAEAG